MTTTQEGKAPASPEPVANSQSVMTTRPAAAIMLDGCDMQWLYFTLGMATGVFAERKQDDQARRVLNLYYKISAQHDARIKEGS
jgi:hypothetical protein